MENMTNTNTDTVMDVWHPNGNAHTSSMVIQRIIRKNL